MNRRFLLLLLTFLTTAVSAQVTLQPKTDSQSSDDTFITKVELTPEYTILTMRWGQSRTPQPQNRIFGKPRVAEISIDPESYLRVVSGELQQRFKFVKATGIPIQPDYQEVIPGDVVVFKVYYERLKPGMEVFTLFECKSVASHQCWNFYGVRVTNPRKRSANPPKAEAPVATAPKKPATPVPKRTEKEILLTGQVFDAKTKQPLDAQLVFRQGQVRVDSAQTIGGLGIYRNPISPGSYDVTVTAAGHQSARLTLPIAASPAQTEQDFYLQPLGTANALAPTPKPTIPDDVPVPLESADVGDKLTLKNIFFETSEASLQPASFPELNRLVAAMRENPALEIRLEGHTDQIGEPARNQALSIERVVAVKRYLVGKGIAPGRIQTKGFGDTRPLTNGRSETERSRNRRVEVIILKK